MTEQDADEPEPTADGTPDGETGSDDESTAEETTPDADEAAGTEQHSDPESESGESEREDDVSKGSDAAADGESTEGDDSETGDDGGAGAPESSVEFKESDLDVADDVLEYVQSADDEELAEEINTLRFEVQTLEDDVTEYEERIEELESTLKRKQADFENYKKRMERRREEEKQRATEDLVERLVDVRDNLKLAVDQDADADIRDGVESTLKQFDRILDEENVTPIEPQPGDEVDPQRHEVLVRMDSEEAPGTIAQVHRPGYEMADKVIRAAQVAVSEE